MSVTTKLLIPAVAAGLLLAAAPAAQAVDAPANDNFGSAAALATANGAVVTTNQSATAEAGEPAILGHAATNSLWYTWTPAKSGRVIFRTQTSSIDTLLAAYTGTSLGSLKQLAANDDAAFLGVNTAQSQVGFQATAGTTYRIAVEGYNLAAVGQIVLSWTNNDSFSAAQPVPGIWNGAVHSVDGTTTGGTREAGEPTIAGKPGGSSVWFNWTAPFTGSADFDSAYTSFDSLLGVYTGSSVSSLTQIAASDNPVPGNVAARVTFNAKKGQLYRIALDGIATAGQPADGWYNLTYSERPTVTLSDASVLEGNSGTKSLPMTFTLSHPSQSSVTLSYATSDGSATAGSDYVTLTGTVTFAPGQTSKTVNVTVKGDTKKEGDEAFGLGYSITAGDADYGQWPMASGTIKNDD